MTTAIIAGAGVLCLGCGQIIDLWLPSTVMAWAAKIVVVVAVSLAAVPLIRRAVIPAEVSEEARFVQAVSETAAVKPIAGSPEFLSSSAELLREIELMKASAAKVSEELSHYHFFTELLRKQTETIKNMTEGASYGIISGLNDLDQRFSTLLNFLDQANSTDRVVTIINRAEAQLEENKRLVSDFSDLRHQEMAEGVERQRGLKKETDQLSGMVRSIRDIAHQTNMLAFNATIEAARAGKAGSGFAVVAGEVKALSRQSDQVARDINSGIDQLVKTIHASLDAIIQGHASEEETGLRKIASTVSDLTENLEKLITHQRDVLAKVHIESQEIARPIMELQASIQFQDVTRQQLDVLVKTGEMVDEHISSLRTVLNSHSREWEGMVSLLQKIDDNYSRYVMAEQRTAHHEVMGDGQSEQTTPKIELF